MSYIALLKKFSKNPRSGSRSGWLPKFNAIILDQSYIFCKKILWRFDQ